MQQRNFFTGEFCLANVTLMLSNTEVFVQEGMPIQIMAYDPGKENNPHAVRAIGDGITPVSNIERVWVNESQLRKDPAHANQRLPGRGL